MSAEMTREVALKLLSGGPIGVEEWNKRRESGRKQPELNGADLEGANLEGANLQGARLKEANLEGANLRRADLKGANLERASLEGANLQGANFEGAILEGANLEGANLERANLCRADLKEASLEGAILEGTNLENANLHRADILGAIVEDDVRRYLLRRQIDFVPRDNEMRVQAPGLSIALASALNLDDMGSLLDSTASLCAAGVRVAIRPDLDPAAAAIEQLLRVPFASENIAAETLLASRVSDQRFKHWLRRNRPDLYSSTFGRIRIGRMERHSPGWLEVLIQRGGSPGSWMMAILALLAATHAAWNQRAQAKNTQNHSQRASTGQEVALRQLRQIHEVLQSGRPESVVSDQWDEIVNNAAPQVAALFENPALSGLEFRGATDGKG